MSDFEARARKAADAVRRQIDEIPAHHEEGIRRAQRSPARFAIPAAVAAAVLIVAVAIGIPRIGGESRPARRAPRLVGPGRHLR